MKPVGTAWRWILKICEKVKSISLYNYLVRMNRRSIQHQCYVTELVANHLQERFHVLLQRVC